MLELFYAEKKLCIGKLLIGFGYEMLKLWPDSNQTFSTGGHCSNHGQTDWKTFVNKYATFPNFS
jgi:hypothetical protein